MSDDRIIELESGDGQVCRCRLVDILPVDGNEYAFLIKLETSDPVVMQVITRGDQTSFRTIENVKQFERVAAYFQAMFGE
jgi:Protein of unknown function (DUF1292)